MNSIDSEPPLPIGFKSKYASVQVMIKDKRYCEWIMCQAWILRPQHSEIYELLSLGIGTDRFNQKLADMIQEHKENLEQQEESGLLPVGFSGSPDPNPEPR